MMRSITGSSWEGKGTRTVILEAGLGDTLDVWKTVQPLIATRCARTLAYNRAGYLGSDNSNAPRDRKRSWGSYAPS